MTQQSQPQSWRDFPQFYGNQVVDVLGHEPRWTISTTQPIDVINGKTGQPYTLPVKSPLDVKELARNGNIRGAWEVSDQCLMTLDELNGAFPGAMNNAFYVSAQIDGVVVLDIEPACPPAIRDELLSLPSLYCEQSMSGNGYHMIMELPDNFYDFPAAVGKRKLQEKHKWYEILIDHWVTFTRTAPKAMSIARGSKDWEQVYAELAQEATQTAFLQFELQPEKPDLPLIDVVISVLKQLPTYPKSLADFHDDYSRWEFGNLGYLYSRVQSLLRTDVMRNAHHWDESSRAWLLYEVAAQMLPGRDKHAEMRNQMPYLLYIATAMVAQRPIEKQ